MRRCTATICLIALLLVTTGLWAGSEPSVGYLLTRRADHLLVRPDLSGLLTDETVGRLENGIGLVLEYHLSLKAPRRFLGARTAAETRGSVQIAYRLISEDFALRGSNRSTDSTPFVGRMPDLTIFLSDSLLVDLASTDSLEPERTYRLELEVTSIFLTDLSLLAGRDDLDSTGAPLEYLFRQFLDVTGYGRQELNYLSRPFRLTDIPIEP